MSPQFTYGAKQLFQCVELFAMVFRFFYSTDKIDFFVMIPKTDQNFPP